MRYKNEEVKCFHSLSCTLTKNKRKKTISVRKSRSEDVNKAKFGSFCAAILSLLFSPYFCPAYSVITWQILRVLLP